VTIWTSFTNHARQMRAIGEPAAWWQPFVAGAAMIAGLYVITAGLLMVSV
jgi:hypothetical protein